jgi:hypothetical protein
MDEGDGGGERLVVAVLAGDGGRDVRDILAGPSQRELRSEIGFCHRGNCSFFDDLLSVPIRAIRG